MVYRGGAFLCFYFLFLFVFVKVLQRQIGKIKLNSRTGKMGHLFCHLPRVIENNTRII